MNDSDSTGRRCVLFRVTGRVQGVWFRGSTRKVAVRLGIVGHAINKADGSVEVLACGTTTALDELAAWLAKGPTGARVDSVAVEDHPDSGVTTFSTG